MELFELTHAIPTNTDPDEVINRITMDDAATDREKFLAQRVHEAFGAAEEAVEEKEDEITSLEEQINGHKTEVEKLEDEKNELQTKVAALQARIPDGTPIASNASLAEVIRAILMDPKATNREKFMVNYFESRGGSWGWHVNEGRY